MKTFPVLWPSTTPERLDYEQHLCPKTVPFAMLEPNRRWAQTNHSQTLERLAERGGMDPFEIVCVIEGRSTYNRQMTALAAIYSLRLAISVWKQERLLAKRPKPRRWIERLRTTVRHPDHYFSHLMERYGFEAFLGSGVAAEILRDEDGRYERDCDGIMERLYSEPGCQWRLELAQRIDAEFETSRERDKRVRMEAERLEHERDEARRARRFILT